MCVYETLYCVLPITVKSMQREYRKTNKPFISIQNDSYSPFMMLLDSSLFSIPIGLTPTCFLLLWRCLTLPCFLLLAKATPLLDQPTDIFDLHLTKANNQSTLASCVGPNLMKSKEWCTCLIYELKKENDWCSLTIFHHSGIVYIGKECWGHDTLVTCWGNGDY